MSADHRVVRRLLAATANPAKYGLLADIFATLGVVLEHLPPHCQLGEKEVGSTLDRARCKAEQIPMQVWTKAYDGVIGVDDGIRINDGRLSPHSKSVTDRILQGGACQMGDRVVIVRAHVSILRDDPAEFRFAISEIPFWYIGNPHGVRRERSGGLPLLRVLSTGGSRPISAQGRAAVRRHFASHSRDALAFLSGGAGSGKVVNR